MTINQETAKHKQLLISKIVWASCLIYDKNKHRMYLTFFFGPLTLYFSLTADLHFGGINMMII